MFLGNSSTGRIKTKDVGSNPAFPIASYGVNSNSFKAGLTGVKTWKERGKEHGKSNQRIGEDWSVTDR